MDELSIEQAYYRKLGKFFLGVSLFHLPIFAITSFIFKTELSIALGLSLFFFIPQALAYLKKPHGKLSLYLFSFVIMCYSGILIHLGKGMIEMHFHVFVFIPITALTGLVLTPLISAVTIAVHHIAFFFILPESLFNYDASFSIVVLHAVFVVIETLISLFISSKFKDFLNKHNIVQTTLKNLNSNFQTEGNNLNKMADEISSQSMKQSSVVQETSSAACEIQTISDKSLGLFKDSVKIIDDSDKEISGGIKIINTGIDITAGMNKVVDETLEEFSSIKVQLKDFEQVMNNISEKTNIINDIVFQTKLLSFNASVEAARAGEHGKGFSVVAEEIGNLAQNSGSAASEINNIVSGSIESFNKLVDHIDEVNDSMASTMTSAVKENIDNSELCQKVFDKVHSGFITLKTSMNEVLASTKEQKAGVDEITKAIENIEKLSLEAKEISDQNLVSSQKIQENNVLLGEFINSFNRRKKKKAS